MELLKGLNEKQKEAVLCCDRPLLILAGAGSGKTKVLTTKIAYIIENNLASKYEILAITFTNKAATEMKDRVSRLLKEDVSSLWIGTFHSICTRILRREISHIGYSNNFTIYDRTDQQSLVKEILKEKAIEVKSFQINGFLAAVSNAKNSGEGKFYIEDFYSNIPSARKYGEIYESYIQKMKEYNALDFDDLILKTLELFKENKDIAEKYSDRFKYVFVDEYQDTNKTQYELVRYFSKSHGNVCVVGDGDQSIYGWRGADISNILNFEKDFKKSDIVLLEENYRSTKNILDVANKVIKNNENRKDKALWTSKKGGDEVIYKRVSSDYEEASMVINWIEHMRYNDYKFDDMAILYRTNAQSRLFEEALMKAGINYHVVGGLKFYDRKEIKDLISYLKIIVNPSDNIALKRIINVPKRSIGNVTVNKIETAANNMSLSIYDYLLHGDIESMPVKTSKNLIKFRDIIENLKVEKENMPLTEFVEYTLEKTGYLHSLEESTLREDKTRIENLGAFISAIGDYETMTENATLEDYLSSVSLLSDVDKTEESSGVSLMTMHAAKGLEYKVVFLTGMEEGLFPSERSISERDGLEEERRLCYVGVTRAEEKLFITSSKTRRVFGRTTANKESRFIKEMQDTIKNESVKEDVEVNFRESYGESVENMKEDLKKNLLGTKKEPKSINKEQFQMSDKVKHKAFGIGTIISIKDESEGDEVIIAFDSKGVKKFKKSLAPITKA